jgi:hypothetical protein
MPCNQAVKIPTVYQTHVFAKLHKQKQKLTAFKNIIWKAIISKGMNAMKALSMFLVLLAIFLLASWGDAFLNHAWLDHLIQFVEPMSKPTNEPTV